MSGALQKYVKEQAIETAKALFANQVDYALVRVPVKQAHTIRDSLGLY